MIIRICVLLKRDHKGSWTREVTRAEKVQRIGLGLVGSAAHGTEPRLERELRLEGRL